MDLPVQQLRDKLLASVRDRGRVLLRAPTGSGKSTCVPPMLLDGGVEGLTVVVQPRRIAARMLARRVTEVRGGRLGEEIGYVVRHENHTGKRTRVVYLTDGVLQRWLHENPTLEGVGAVVFDEFHERRVASDVALARCLDLQDGARPGLKLVVMSATLEVEGLQRYLEPCQVLEAEGRMFPVEVSYRGAGAPAPGGRQAPALWDRVADAVKVAVTDSDAGHILVFLPGVYEIRRTMDLLTRATWSRGWDVCPLYSSLPPAQQDAAVSPGTTPRIIVSTNVAETSLTIEGVRTVIDSGLARISDHDPARGIDTLMIEKISRASADQRAGRAGRTAPGRCVRLWSERDHARRIPFELPEIRRTDLSEVLLSLLAAGVENVAHFRWLTVPDEVAVERAMYLLENLGAVVDGTVTAMGKRMAGFPLHPRYARLLLAGQESGCVAEAGFIAAAIQSESVFVRGKGGRKEFSEPGDTSDFAAEWRAFQLARDMRFDPARLSVSGIMARGARELGKTLGQLEKLALRHGLDWGDVCFSHSGKLGGVMALALGDRLAAQHGAATLSCRVVGGRRGQLDAESVVRGAQVFAAAEMTEVEGKEVTVHLSRCTEIGMDALKARFPDDFHEHDGALYDEKTRRVVRVREIRFRDLVLESREGGDPPPDEAARLLAGRVVAGELKLNKWDRSVEQWIARLVNLARWMPEMELPGFSDSDRELVIGEVCQGARSYKEIKNREVMPVLKNWLSAAQKSVLDAYAPTEVKLSNGRTAKVRYAADAEPWIAMKMQHLYDVTALPEIAGGKASLLVHILAPNQRPWQVTGDLKGFWERGYPQMKKDLAGRYPKHEWR